MIGAVFAARASRLNPNFPYKLVTMQGGRQLSVGLSLPRPCIRRQQKIRPISGDNGLALQL